VGGEVNWRAGTWSLGPPECGKSRSSRDAGRLRDLFLSIVSSAVCPGRGDGEDGEFVVVRKDWARQGETIRVLVVHAVEVDPSYVPNVAGLDLHFMRSVEIANAIRGPFGEKAV